MLTSSRVLANLSRPLDAGWPVRYGLALLIAGAAVCLRGVPHRLIDEGSPFLVFLFAVIVAGLHLGTGPAVLCLLVTFTAIVTLFVPQAGLRLEPSDVMDLALFLLTAASLIGLLHAHLASRAKLERTKGCLEAQAARLEHEVAERRRAEEMLRRSNEELEDFTHAVSHDLKEPLRGIAFTAAFLLEDSGAALGEEGRDRLRTLVRLPEQMRTQLTALLEYSHAGRTDLALRPTDIGMVIAGAVDPLGPWLAEHAAEVATRRPCQVVRCDAVRGGHIFSNLVVNAVKFNDSSPRRVEVGVRGDGPIPVFYVRDNGIGIPPERAASVFRMFGRLHHEGDYGGGTGSGLALVKKTVERHGGRIWFETEPGRGTTFWFTLGPGAPVEPTVATTPATETATGAEAAGGVATG